MSQTDPEEYAVYISVKMDADVLKLAKGAAGVLGLSVQDYISDVINVAAAKELNRKPVKRKPPRPRTK